MEESKMEESKMGKSSSLKYNMHDIDQCHYEYKSIETESNNKYILFTEELIPGICQGMFLEKK